MSNTCTQNKPEDDKEKVETRKKELEEFLGKLKEAREENRNRLGEGVQKIEKEFNEKFNVPPTSWIPKDTALEDVISHFEQNLEKLSDVLRSRDTFSDADVLTKASGGQALRGILLTSNIDDLLTTRSTLLECPENVFLKGPCIESKDVIEQFNSKSQEDTYKKSVDVLGYGISVSGSVPVYGGVTVNAGVAASQKTEDEDMKKVHNKVEYFSTVKQSFLHLKSYTFEDSDLMLSRNALSALIEINKALEKYGHSTYVQDLCYKFYRKYGSHANKGPIHFGGQYYYTCSSSGFEKSELEEVKQVQSNSVESSVGAVFMGFGASTQVDITKVTGRHSGNLSEGTKAQTYLVVRTMGGPPEVNGLPEWRTGLVASNDTWCVTKRGDEMLVPVWEIIDLNYKEEMGKLCHMLNQAWNKLVSKKIFMLKLEMALDENLANKPEEVIEEVQKQNSSKPFVVDEEFLKYLIEVKRDIAASANPKAWVEVYLQECSLQIFLLSVMEQQASQQASTNASIKFLIRKVVEKSDLEKLTVSSFIEKDQITNWLYSSDKPRVEFEIKCKDLEGFIKLLKKLKREMDKAKVTLVPISADECAESVTSAVYSLSCSRKDMYEDALVTTLLYPFKSGNSYDPMMLKPLSTRCLEYLCQQMEKRKVELADYQNRDPPQLQAYYLFNLAIAVYSDCKDGIDECIEEAQLRNHLLFLKNKLGNCMRFFDQLDMFINQICTIEVLQSELRARLNNNSQPPPSSGIHSIQMILSKVQGMHNQPRVVVPVVVEPLTSGSKVLIALLEKLGLEIYYPAKMSLQHALSVRRDHEVKASGCIEPKQLPYLFLDKIMTRNHNFLTDINSRPIHPMDCLVCLIHCADDFLRQDMMTRIASCQLALPLILPDFTTQQELIFNLWGLYSIVKEWRSEGANNEIIEHERPIITYDAPVISFMRLGERKSHKVSKSKVLNDVISNSQYKHFFHRDCRGGKLDQMLGLGLIDMCWYFPAHNEEEEIFSDATIFLNLHGNACDPQLERQVKLLSHVSSMNFVLLTEPYSASDEAILKQLSEGSGALVILTEEDELSTQIKALSDKLPTITLSEDKNAYDVQEEIRETIRNYLEDNQARRSVASFGDIIQEKSIKIKIDMHEERFTKGKKLAEELLDILANKENDKNSMLPLQGRQQWRAWAKHDKEQYRQVNIGNTTVDKYALQKEQDKKNVRQKQLHSLDNVSPVMESFIVSLLSVEDEIKKYYLQFLELGLNSISREHITVIKHQYQEERKKLTDLQNEKKEAHKIVKQKEKLEHLREILIDTSFGLEHLFRELGQVYEAAVYNGLRDQDYSQFPCAVAELLIDGFPLEIMDGDAAHVPVKWLSAVIKQVIAKLKDKLKHSPHIFVMSVLGLQSTGKSTMLNTVFGLQFKVSAGRCTRGAFMQLIPIDEACKASVNGCDYILVVDTEGLRALELDQSQMKNHDNELATFVIGLANVTLINIYGEVPGDINDILQTSVHAFIRMNRVNLKPSCFFVHQNAEAKSKGEMGRDKLLERLDEMTCHAAKEAKCADQYQCFNHVIKFNGQEHVYHFPGLWLGEPPMAPVNQKYSLKAKSLRSQVIKLLEVSNIAEFSEFEIRLDNLWDALLHENFVFSFKNTMEITAYNDLEKCYHQWEWEFQEAVINWRRTAENQIDTADSTDDIQQKLNDELSMMIEEHYEDLKKKMDEHFNGKQKDLLAQWKASFEKKLLQLSETLKQGAETHCRQLIKGKSVMAEVIQARNDYSIRITNRVKELVADLQKRQDELRLNFKLKQLLTVQLQTMEKLFDSEKLQKYTKLQILNEAEVEIISKCGPLTTETLSDIIYSKLSPDQVNLILDQPRLSEKELKEVFTEQWIKIVNEIPCVQVKQIDIEDDVKKEIEHFVGLDMHKVLRPKLIGKGALRIDALKLKARENDHVSKRGAYMTERLKGWAGYKVMTDSEIKRAQDTTDVILGFAKQYLAQIKSDAYDSNYTSQLLKILKDATDQQTEAVRDLEFTKEYYIDIYLTACGYAINVYEQMLEHAMKKQNPRFYLEEEVKGPLLTMFIDEYNKIAHEEAIANSICQLLERPLQREVQKRLGTKVVDFVMSHDSTFSSKPTFKVRVLIDLAEHALKTGELDGFFLYFASIEQSLDRWIEEYTRRHCEEKIGSHTRLQHFANSLMEELVTFTVDRVDEVSKEFESQKVSTEAWLSKFFENQKLRDTLGTIQTRVLKFKGCDEQQEMILESFTEKLIQGLERLAKNFCDAMVTFDNVQLCGACNPCDALRGIIGCCKQCPFCGEQCNWSVHDPTVKHEAQHRFDCINGFKMTDTRIMTIDVCTTLVGTKHSFRNKKTEGKYRKYKDYQEKSLYPDWRIKQDRRIEASMYWKWFVGKYHQQLAEHYSMKDNDEIPSEWTCLNWEDVKCALKKEFNL